MDWTARIAQDLRYATRVLTRQPRFALLAIATMALGIGATTVLFSVTYGVLMKPLPWADADRIVTLKETRGGRAPRFGAFSSTAYSAWRGEAATVDTLAAWSPRTMTISGAGEPERIRLTTATASLFRVLDVQPLIGSLFSERDETSPVIVLSEGLWRQRFGGDPAALGRLVHLDGQPHTIVGVVADRFAFPDRQARAWVPFHVAPPNGNFLSMFEAVAKLRPGATAAQAAAEGRGRGRFAADTGMTTTAIFGGNGPIEVTAQPLRDAFAGDTRRPLIVLLAAVVLLLAIATTNVASLQLARGMSRRREFAIRGALGASRGRVMRQLVIESLLLGAAGAAVGIGLAFALHRGTIAILPADFPRVADLTIDLPVLLFAIGVSVLASLAFGVLPALRLRRLNLVQGLTEDGVSPTGVSWRSTVARSRLLIIAMQMAAACVLLVGASLLARSFVALVDADRGYDPASVLAAPIPMTGPGYTPERRSQVLGAIVDRLRATPGVRDAAFTSEAPLTPGGSTSSMTLPPLDGSGAPIVVQASPRLVSAGYFSVLDLRVLQGRSLEESDTATSQPVVVVNDTFARRYLGDRALGRTLPMGVWGDAGRGDATIVGVVEDIRYIGAAATSMPEMYFAVKQLPFGMRSPTGTVLVRADGEPSALTPTVRSVVREADANLVPGSVMTLEERLLASSLARPRLYAILLGGFAILAVLVTGVGLFGVLSYTVAQRTRELGVRAALGARRIDLVLLVVRQGLGITLGGIAAGLIASVWLTRSLATLLYGVTLWDGLTYAVVPLILLAVALAACLAPARRAATLDPLRALRS